MRHWKRGISLFTAAAIAAAAPLTAGAASPEFARTQEEWDRLRDNVIEYDELADLIHEYNITVHSNQIKLQDYSRNKTSEEIAQGYLDAADEIEAGIEYGDDPASIAAAKSAQERADSMRAQADRNVDDRETVKLDFDGAEANLVAQAQTRMIAYFTKQLDLEAARKNRELLARNYDAVAARKAGGMATQIDVLSAMEELQKADADILAAQSELDNTRQKLCVMLGWSYNASPEIREIPAADRNRIPGMDPEADREKALENNYTLRANKKRLDNTVSSSDRETLQATIIDNEQKIGSALVADYQAVLQANAAYDQAAAELALETRNLETAKLNLQLGYASQLEYTQQEVLYFTKQIAWKKADMALFSAMETYDWAVAGLAEAQ